LPEPERAAIIKMEKNSLQTLWEGMQGDIFILYPAFSKERLKSEIEYRQNIFNLPVQTISDLSQWLSRFGSYLSSGDVFAINHFYGLLSSIYGANRIRFSEAFSLLKAEKNERDQVLKENLILIGGPCGNPIASLILKEYNILKWMFPLYPNDDYEIGISTDGKEVLTPMPPPINGLPQDLQSDIGAFILLDNPFNKNRNVYGAMGACTWGTQGAASLACSLKGAANILSSKKYAPADFPEAIKYYCVTSVGRKNGSVINKNDASKPLNDLIEPDLRLNLAFPGPKGEEIYNPIDVVNAQSMLIDDLWFMKSANIRIKSPIAWGRAYFLALFSIFSSAILFYLFSIKLSWEYIAPVCLFILGAIFFLIQRLPNPR
jgi:hypothetical protein